MDARWCFVSQGFVRPEGVVFFHEGIKEPLFESPVWGRRASGLGLELPMHALMAAVLARAARIGINGKDIMFQEPDRE